MSTLSSLSLRHLLMMGTLATTTMGVAWPSHAHEVEDTEAAPSASATASLHLALVRLGQNTQAIGEIFGMGESAADVTGFLSAIDTALADVAHSTLDAAQCHAAERVAPSYLDASPPNRSGAPYAQLETAAFLTIAKVCNTVPLHVAAQRTVAMSLPEVRATEGSERYRSALERYGAFPILAELVAPPEGSLIPLAEAHITNNDYASVRRMMHAVLATKPPQRIASIVHYGQTAAQQSLVRVKVNTPAGCAATVDGRPVTTRTLDLTQGTHALACAPGDASIRRVSMLTETLFPTDADGNLRVD